MRPLETKATVRRAAYTIALVCASFVIGLFLQAKRSDCVAPQLAPTPKLTAIMHHSGNGHPIP